MKLVKTKEDRIDKRKNPLKYCTQGNCLETKNLKPTSVWNDMENPRYYCPTHFKDAEESRKYMLSKHGDMGKMFKLLKRQEAKSKQADKIISAINKILKDLDNELVENLSKEKASLLYSEVDKLSSFVKTF